MRATHHENLGAAVATVSRMGRAEVARAIFERGWNQQAFDGLTSTLERFRFHIRGETREMEVAELAEIVATWHEGFADFHFEIHSIAASDDVAAVHATLHGTHTGTWQGLAPTGRDISVEHMFFLHFDGEHITDVWELLDSPALRSQLGVDG